MAQKKNISLIVDSKEEEEKPFSSLIVDESITVRLFNSADPQFPCDYVFYKGDMVTDKKIQNIIKHSGKKFHFK